MKKLVVAAIFMTVTWGLTFAQTKDKPTEFKEPEKVTVNGTLAFVKGRIAVQSADAVYFTGNDLNTLVGFVDGFKEGAAVKLEGYVFTSPRNDPLDNDVKFMRTLKITFNGKDYELRADIQNDKPFRRTQFNSQNFHRNKPFLPNRSGFYSHHNKWNRPHF
jgi:hypothetical protein